MYRFEFDLKKSLSNLDKRGIDFVNAQTIWVDPDIIEVQAKTIVIPPISNCSFQ